MSERKFYRTVFQVEVLSETPILGHVDLEDIAYQGTEGEWSVDMETVETETVGSEQMAELLIAQGSDPGFFGIEEE